MSKKNNNFWLRFLLFSTKWVIFASFNAYTTQTFAMKKHTLHLILALFGLTFSLSSCRGPVSEDVAYIFTSFREPSTQGMQYLYSLDGLHWDTLPGIWLAPMVGNDTTYVDAWTGQVQAPKYYPDERVMRGTARHRRDGRYPHQQRLGTRTFLR